MVWDRLKPDSASGLSMPHLTTREAEFCQDRDIPANTKACQTGGLEVASGLRDPVSDSWLAPLLAKTPASPRRRCPTL